MLLARYNRRLIPIMLDERLVEKIIDFRKNYRTEEEVESKVQRFMDQENTRIYKDFKDTKHKDGLDLMWLLKDEDKQHCLVNCIRTTTVHGHQNFVVTCTDMLLKNTPQLRDTLGGRPRGDSKAGPKESWKRVLKTDSKLLREVSKSKGASLNLRRSTRIKNAKLNEFKKEHSR